MPDPFQHLHSRAKPQMVPTHRPYGLDLGAGIGRHRRGQDPLVALVVGARTVEADPLTGLDDAVGKLAGEGRVAGEQGMPADGPQHRAVVGEPVDGLVQGRRGVITWVQFVAVARRHHGALLLLENLEVAAHRVVVAEHVHHHGQIHGHRCGPQVGVDPRAVDLAVFAGRGVLLGQVQAEARALAQHIVHLRFRRLETRSRFELFFPEACGLAPRTAVAQRQLAIEGFALAGQQG